ncbi:Serine active site containing protein 1 [Lobaria immixta]|nr:Serine active site containing protein 1 [Lobaria immixta]
MSQGLSEPLSNPGDAIVELSIVFIHGLQGDPKGTWTTFNTFWPRDLLPEILPQARILSWGYDSKVIHFWAAPSQNMINEHSSNLFADLASLRDSTNTSRRPIIFVAHSLGGIVCANALLLAGNSPEEPVREIGKRTRGIAFLGTPFEGSDKAKWAETGLRFFLLFKDTNDAIPTDLREDSNKLSDVGEAFPDLLRRRRESEEPRSKIEVTCFCEERRTKILGLAGLETVRHPQCTSEDTKVLRARDTKRVTGA